MTADAIASQLEYLAHRLRFGCGNAGCQISPPEGIPANGACRCEPKNFARQLMGLAIECEHHGSRWPHAKETKP